MESGTPLFEGTHFAVLAAFNEASPVLFIAPAINSLLMGIGIEWKHDGNGIPPGGPDKDQALVVVTAAYMLHNQVPFAMGPEIAIAATLAPGSPFDTTVVTPGWAFWYAPWKAPIAIGTALDVSLTFPKGAKAIIATTTPSVRIVFGFH
jgi:hypothetical protein